VSRKTQNHWNNALLESERLSTKLWLRWNYNQTTVLYIAGIRPRSQRWKVCNHCATNTSNCSVFRVFLQLLWIPVARLESREPKVDHLRVSYRPSSSNTTCICHIPGLQINIWLDTTFVRSLLILVGHNLNLVGQKPTSLNLVGYIRHKIYISHETSLYSHSDATLSKMLECLIAKCKLEWICNRILSQQKNV
jgi:hypothetical protein